MAPRARFDPFGKMIEFSKTQDRHKENSARLAMSFGQYATLGWGEFSPEDAIVFDSPFLYRPAVMYGASLEDEDDVEELRNTRLPRCGGVVVRFDRTASGWYTAAYVIITVEDRSPFIEPTDPDPDPEYNIIHDFTFLGIAVKDIQQLKGDLKEV